MYFYELSNRKGLFASVWLLIEWPPEQHLLLLFSFSCLFRSLVFSVHFLFPQIPHVFPPRLEDEGRRKRFDVILGAELGPATDVLCNLVSRPVTSGDCCEDVIELSRPQTWRWVRQGLETSTASPIPFWQPAPVPLPNTRWNESAESYAGI